MLNSSIGQSVDCVAYDLEDSVAWSKKAEARSNLRSFLSQPRPPGIKEQAVRINAVESGLALDDLTEVVLQSLIVCPNKAYYQSSSERHI